MKITRLGGTRPLLTIGSIIGGGTAEGGTQSPAPPGQVPTSTGSNSVSWGSNVGVISAGGSNVLGPYVNFAAGSNVTLTIDQTGSAASNTIRIHATAAGGNPADDTYAWMPLSSVASNTINPELVWDGDDSLIPTLVPV